MIANIRERPKTRRVKLKIEITQEMASRIWAALSNSDPLADGIPITMTEVRIVFHGKRTSLSQAIKEGRLHTVNPKIAREIIERAKEIRCLIDESSQDSRFCLWILSSKDNQILFEVEPYLFEKFIKASLNRHRLLEFYTASKRLVDDVH